MQILWIAFLLNVISFGQSNILPNSIDVDEFLQTEIDMITKMKSYISHERDRLELLRKHLGEWKEWRDSYRSKENDYITNPVNMFHLFKKLTTDFQKVEKIMTENSYDDVMKNDDIKPPTDEHLKSLVLSLVSIQYTYDLQPQDIINGKLMGVASNTLLSEEACFFIGETCLEYNEHRCAINWLNTCMTMVKDTEKRKKIYKLMYPSFVFLNDKEEAHAFSNSYLSLDPLEIAASDVKLDTGLDLGKLIPFEKAILEAYRLCRGAYKETLVKRNFKCRYNYENTPFLRIAPLKEEMVYDDPKILLYRDAVYDSEIETIKNWAKDRMATSTVYGSDGNRRVTGFIYRISQTAFMDNKSKFLSNLTDRIEDISDLSLNSSEWWQIINYSPGGFYRVHSDYLPVKAEEIEKTGNRMTSILFYMNDVPLGGATVFPYIKLAVSPSKGSALIWHNVLPDGSENVNTQHCACPVILGEKWAFTQWIRTINQKCLRHIYEKYSENPSGPSIQILDTSGYKIPQTTFDTRKDIFKTLIHGVSDLHKMIRS